MIGAVLLAAAVTVVVVGSVRACSRFMPESTGASSRLAEACTTLVVLLGVAQLLGALRLLDPVPLLGALFLAGGGLWVAAGRVPQLDATEASAETSPSVFGRWGALVTAGSLALVMAIWLPLTFTSLRDGISTADSIWYHLPEAARFAQNGAILDIQHFDSGGLTAYYPFVSQLLHSIPMVVTGSDIVSPVINLGWAALALLAAWCVGRSRSVAPATFVGMATILVLPGFVALQSGGAHNDVVGLALLVAAIAVLLRPDAMQISTGSFPIALAGALTGLALGTKWVFIPAAALITLGVIYLAPRAERVRVAGTWFVASGLLGLGSYARNLAATGNPLPPVDLRFAGFGFDRATPKQFGESSLAELVLGDSWWSEYLKPGLDLMLGVAWPALVLLAVGGALAAVIAGPGRPIRLLGLLAIGAGLAYALAPQVLYLFDRPFYFQANIRYGMLAPAIGLIALPLTRPTHGSRSRWVTLVAMAGILFVSAADTWPTGIEFHGFAAPVESWAVALGLAVGLAVLAITGLAVWRPSARSRSMAAVMISLILMVTLGAVAVTNQSAPPDWVRDLSGERIGLQGNFLQYPLVGSDLSNTVQYIVGETPDGRVHEISRCDEWMAAANDGRYTYIRTSGFIAAALSGDEIVFGQGTPPPHNDWLDADPSAEVFLQDGNETVYRISGVLDPDRCPAEL